MKKIALLFVIAATLSASFPDFLVLGAQKGGTTSLYEYLKEHPSIEMPRIKEVEYFSRNFNFGVKKYLSHFPDKNKHGYPLSGDVSPDYLHHPFAAKRACELLPDVKLIALLRNPVDRAYSRYRKWVEHGITRESFEKLTLDEINFINRGRVGPYPKFDFIHLGLYAEQLKRWLKHYPKEQLLVILSEDFYENTQECMDRIYDHIGLPHHEYESFPIANEGPNHIPMDPRTREQLHEFYRPYNQELQKILDELDLGITLDWK